MLRLGARELGWGTTEEVARELSAFADVCLDVAVAHCDAALTREIGAPRADSGAPGRFVVMAMGKLGGEELNFSSDIDVCYFYSTDAGSAGEQTLHAYYAELARRVTAAIEQPTGDGMIFRVDLRLRPEGRSGPIVQRAGGGRALLRDVRPHLGAAGLAARAPLRRRSRAGRRAAGGAGAVHLPAQHRPAHDRRGARAARALPRSGRRSQRAGRDRVRREAGLGRHPRRRDGRAGAAAPARRQARRPARAQHAARAAASGGGGAAGRA